MDIYTRKRSESPRPQERKEVRSEASSIKLGTLKTNKLSGTFEEERQDVKVAGREKISKGERTQRNDSINGV